MVAGGTEVEREIWKISGFVLRSNGDIGLPGEAADLACLKFTHIKFSQGKMFCFKYFNVQFINLNYLIKYFVY